MRTKNESMYCTKWDARISSLLISAILCKAVPQFDNSGEHL